jgi:hypothetical protein
LIIVTTVSLSSSNSALPDDGDDGVTAPKHVAAVLMSILMYILKLLLRQFTCASVGEYKTLTKPLRPLSLNVVIVFVITIIIIIVI